MLTSIPQPADRPVSAYAITTLPAAARLHDESGYDSGIPIVRTYPTLTGIPITARRSYVSHPATDLASFHIQPNGFMAGPVTGTAF
jgi:hypothetical protein